MGVPQRAQRRLDCELAQSYIDADYTDRGVEGHCLPRSVTYGLWHRA
jgi:hypothetical protein